MQIRWFQLAAVAATSISLAACSETPDAGASAPRAAVRTVPVIAEPLTYEHAGTKIEAIGTSRAILSATFNRPLTARGS